MKCNSNIERRTNMNKVVKTIASTTLAFGTLLGGVALYYQYKIPLMQQRKLKGITTLIMVTLIKTLNS